MELKKCKVCCDDRPISEYKLLKGKWRGNVCRKCRNTQRTTHYHENEKTREGYMDKNVERVAAWKSKNPDRTKSSSKHWRDNSERGYWSKKISSIKANSKFRGIKHELTVDDLMILYEKQKGLCALSGRILEKTNSRSLNSLSIDRKDGSDGYTPDNIRLVCWQANAARLDGTDEELFEMCIDILKHNGKL